MYFVNSSAKLLKKKEKNEYLYVFLLYFLFYGKILLTLQEVFGLVGWLIDCLFFDQIEEYRLFLGLLSCCFYLQWRPTKQLNNQTTKQPNN